MGCYRTGIEESSEWKEGRGREGRWILQVETLILTANNIEDTGVASAFDADFEKMEKVRERREGKMMG